MSRKSIKTIAIGLLILAITFVAFNALFDATAPSEAEIFAANSSANASMMAYNSSGSMADFFAVNSAVQAVNDKSQQAEGVRNLFYVVAALEVIITGVLAFKWRDES